MEDAVYGIETLLNLTYANTETRGKGFYTDTYEFSVSTSSNWLDMLTHAETETQSKIVQNQDGLFRLSTANVELVEQIGEEYLISIAYYFEELNADNPGSGGLEGSTNSNHSGIPCSDVFDKDEEFVLGWMDNEIHPNPSCNYCSRPDKVDETVFGAIENFMNSVLPEPCPENHVIFITDIDDGERGMADHFFHWGDCYDSNEPVDFYFASCFSGERANCFLCEIFEMIEANDGLPFNIPEGSSLLSVDISIDFAPTGDNECERPTQVVFAYTFGKIRCAYKCPGCPNPTGGNSTLDVAIPPFNP